MKNTFDIPQRGFQPPRKGGCGGNGKTGRGARALSCNAGTPGPFEEAETQDMLTFAFGDVRGNTRHTSVSPSTRSPHINQSTP